MTRSARPPISPRMKVNSLLHQVFVQFGAYLKDPETKEDMPPESDVQFDHGWSFSKGADRKKHTWRDIRPMLRHSHKKKSARDERDCHHVDRLEKERNGLPKRKRDLHKKQIPSRPMPEGRPFQQGSRPLKTGNRFQQNKEYLARIAQESGEQT